MLCRAGCLLVAFLAATSLVERATAQDEQIDDPELTGMPTASQSPSATDSAASLASEARLGLHSRLSLDLNHRDPRDEVWASTTIAALEATVRRSELLRFAVGVRARFHVSALRNDLPDANAQRVEFDATPTSGYVDLKLAQAANLQLGYQPVHLGRLALISAVDVLSSGDYRDGPATMPEALDVAQLAARFDYDPTASLSLRVIYVPFFTPHMVAVTESDYALFHLSQAQLAAGLAALDLDAGVLAANLSRADRERLAATGLSAFAPDADLRSQQAAVRATLHGALGELSLTVATALEHLPAFQFAQATLDYLRDPGSSEATLRLQQTARPIQVDYGRFGLVALDGSMEIASMSIGFEAAYMMHRTLYALGTGPSIESLPLPDTTDVIQAGAHLEYVRGNELVSTIEAFAAYAVSAPHDPARSWVFLQHGVFAGVAAAGAWQSKFGLRVAVSMVAMTGFTFIVTPRIAYDLIDGLEVELGAFVIGGPPPPPNLTPQLALGTLYDGTDLAYVGLSYAL